MQISIEPCDHRSESPARITVHLVTSYSLERIAGEVREPGKDVTRRQRANASDAIKAAEDDKIPSRGETVHRRSLARSKIFPSAFARRLMQETSASNSQPFVVSRVIVGSSEPHPATRIIREQPPSRAEPRAAPHRTAPHRVGRG